MATLENIGLIGSYGKNSRVMLKLQFSDGTSKTEKFVNGDSILVDGNKVGEIIAIGEKSVDILQTATGKTFTLEVGEIGQPDDVTNMQTDARRDAPLVSVEGIPDDVSGRTSTPEPIDFSDISFPARRPKKEDTTAEDATAEDATAEDTTTEDAATFDQSSVLDFGKMTPLREESITPEPSTGEFRPTDYRVSQINENVIEPEDPTATIYNIVKNVNVGNYKKGDVIPQFENRVVENVDADAKTVTLDDGSVIVYQERNSTKLEPGDKTLNSNQQEKIDDLNISDDKKQEISGIIEELNGQNIQAYPIVDPNTGEIIIATNVLSDNQGLPLSYTPNQAQGVLSANGLRFPTISEYELMRSNWDYQQVFKAFGSQLGYDGKYTGSARFSDIGSNPAAKKEKLNFDTYYISQRYNRFGPFTGGATKVFVFDGAIYGGYGPGGSLTQPLFSKHLRNETDYSEGTVGVLRTGIFGG